MEKSHAEFLQFSEKEKHNKDTERTKATDSLEAMKLTHDRYLLFHMSDYFDLILSRSFLAYFFQLFNLISVI